MSEDLPSLEASDNRTTEGAAVASRWAADHRESSIAKHESKNAWMQKKELHNIKFNFVSVKAPDYPGEDEGK